MNYHSDLINQLRNRLLGLKPFSLPVTHEKDPLCQQAADTIESLEMRVAELEQILTPFANLATSHDEKYGAGEIYQCTFGLSSVRWVPILRKARAALNKG